MPEKSDDAAEPATTARRILVVDDDADFAEGLGAVLEEAGHEVRLALSAAEGLHLLGAFIPDVAIADIRMPVVDGYALLAILRADPNLDACTFIGVSGNAHEETKGADAFDHFFNKPLEMGELLEAVAHRARSRRLH